MGGDFFVKTVASEVYGAQTLPDVGELIALPLHQTSFDLIKMDCTNNNIKCITLEC
jgi:hypothetical protein